MGKRRLNGAGDGIRTRDINLGKVALYQLSYSRVATPSFSRDTAPVVNFMQSSYLNHILGSLFS